MQYRVINREVGINTPDLVNREFPNLHDATVFAMSLMGHIMDGSTKHEVIRVQVKGKHDWVTFANFSFNYDEYDDTISYRESVDYIGDRGGYLAPNECRTCYTTKSLIVTDCKEHN